MMPDSVSNNTIDSDEYLGFCKFLEDSCGIVLGDNKHYLVTSRLNRLMRKHSIESLGALLAKLNKGLDRALHDDTVDAMTTNETSWFRDRYPYDLLKDEMLPSCEENIFGKIRVWSAACSSGQEPYSISIVDQEYRRTHPASKTKIEIIATDISPSMLDEAKLGVFDNMALGRGMPDDLKKRYFTAKGDAWQVQQQVKSSIQFREINLMNSFASLGKFDVIFCRNVLIYFSGPMKTDILKRMSTALKPNGFLFLGGSESVTSYTDRFEQILTPKGLYYKNRP